MTTETKHTQGPWAVVKRNSGTAIYSEGTTPKVMICVGLGEPRERQANARLIAASPALLSALADLLHYVQVEHEEGGFPDDDLPEICNAAKAAIAKAIGG